MTKAHGDELPASPLFGGVDPADWAELLSRATRLDLDACQPIYTQGEAADAFYAVLAGTVEVRIKSSNGPDQVLAHLGAGSVLGETSLFLGGEHSASIQTSEPSTLLRFGNDDFKDLIAQKQTGAIRVLFNMGHALAVRLRGADDQLAAAPVGAGVMRNDRPRTQRFMNY